MCASCVVRALTVFVVIAPTLPAQSAPRTSPWDAIQGIASRSVELAGPPVSQALLRAPSSARAAEVARSRGTPSIVAIDEQIGDPTIKYQDAEIWNELNLMSWQEGRNNWIWVCRIDPQTGALQPADGRGKRIARAARAEGDLWARFLFGVGRKGTWNSAEWGVSAEGLGLYFTILDENRVMQAARYRFNTGAVEQLTFGTDMDRRGAMPTLNRELAQCRIAYFHGELDGSPNVCWQYEDDSAVEYPIPIGSSGVSGLRWFPDGATITTNLYQDDSTLQVARYDAASGVTRILTDGPEWHFDAYPYRDPRDAGGLRIVCIEERGKIAVYRETVGNGVWKKLRIIEPAVPLFPEDKRRIVVAKPFIYRGRAWCVYTLTVGLPYYFPSLVAVASLDGEVNEVVSGPELLHRDDPEFMTAGDLVFIIYHTEEGEARRFRRITMKLPALP